LGNQRFVAGNSHRGMPCNTRPSSIVTVLVAGLLIIAVAVFASLPFSNRPLRTEITSKSDSRRYKIAVGQETRGAEDSATEHMRSNIASSRGRGVSEEGGGSCRSEDHSCWGYLSFEVGVMKGKNWPRMFGRWKFERVLDDEEN